MVWSGRRTGVFTNWDEAQASVLRFPGSGYLGFTTLREANAEWSRLQKGGKEKAIGVGVTTRSRTRELASEEEEWEELGELVMPEEGGLSKGKSGDDDGNESKENEERGGEEIEINEESSPEEQSALEKEGETGSSEKSSNEEQGAFCKEDENGSGEESLREEQSTLEKGDDSGRRGETSSEEHNTGIEIEKVQVTQELRNGPKNGISVRGRLAAQSCENEVFGWVGCTVCTESWEIMGSGSQKEMKEKERKLKDRNWWCGSCVERKFHEMAQRMTGMEEEIAELRSLIKDGAKREKAPAAPAALSAPAATDKNDTKEKGKSPEPVVRQKSGSGRAPEVSMSWETKIAIKGLDSEAGKAEVEDVVSIAGGKAVQVNRFWWTKESKVMIVDVGEANVREEVMKGKARLRTTKWGKVFLERGRDWKVRRKEREELQQNLKRAWQKAKDGEFVRVRGGRVVTYPSRDVNVTQRTTTETNPN